MFLLYLYPHRLVVPRMKTSYGDRGFSVHGPSVWNSLPNDLRSTVMSIETFRARLKAFLFGHWLQPICCFLQMALLLLLLFLLTSVSTYITTVRVSGVLSPEATKYVQEVPAINFRREINFYAYMKGKTHCT